MMLGQRLQNIRTEHEMSQEEVAETLNVSRQTISRWERNVTQPTADHLGLLSELFRIPVDAFLKDDWRPPEEAESVVGEMPLEVPVPAPKHFRLWVLLVAFLIAAGILFGVMLWWGQNGESVSVGNLESEVIDPSAIGHISYIPFG